MDFCYRYKKLIKSFSFFYRYDLLQPRNSRTKFRSAMCSCCEVMAVLDGLGWIFATGMKNWSIFLLFFIDIICYSYEILVQTFEALCAVVVNVKTRCRSCGVRAECRGSECRSVGRSDAGVKDVA